MPLPDWDVEAPGGANIGIQAASPILGTGSLQVNLVASQNCDIHRNAGFARGFTKGRVRTLLRIDSANASSHAVGLFCMSSSLNIRFVGNDFYGFIVDEGTTDNLEIGKWTNGAVFTPDVSFGTASQTIAFGDVIPIELEWNLDVPGIGGIALTGRTGNVGDLDFSNLTTRVAFSEFGTQLSSTFSEGIWGATAAGNDVDARFEQTEIFSGA